MSSREITNAKGFGDKSKIQERLNEIGKEMTDYPNAKKHQIVSFIKSGIRIVGQEMFQYHLS